MNFLKTESSCSPSPVNTAATLAYVPCCICSLRSFSTCPPTSLSNFLHLISLTSLLLTQDPTPLFGKEQTKVSRTVIEARVLRQQGRLILDYFGPYPMTSTIVPAYPMDSSLYKCQPLSHVSQNVTLVNPSVKPKHGGF